MATTAGDEQTVKFMLKRWQDPETGLDEAWREEYLVYLSFPDPKNPNKVTVGESAGCCVGMRMEMSLSPYLLRMSWIVPEKNGYNWVHFCCVWHWGAKLLSAQLPWADHFSESIWYCAARHPRKREELYCRSRRSWCGSAVRCILPCWTPKGKKLHMSDAPLTPL